MGRGFESARPFLSEVKRYCFGRNDAKKGKKL